MKKRVQWLKCYECMRCGGGLDNRNERQTAESSTASVSCACSLVFSGTEVDKLGKGLQTGNDHEVSVWPKDTEVMDRQGEYDEGDYNYKSE